MIRAHEGSGDKIHLNWFDGVEKEAKEAQSGELEIKSAVSNVKFSHRGTYAAVCEAEGVRIFVGQSLK